MTPASIATEENDFRSEPNMYPTKIPTTENAIPAAAATANFVKNIFHSVV